MKDKKTSPKKMRGKVVSTAMQNTLVVEVGRLVAHPIYKKRRVISKKYKVHYTTGEYAVGDIVNFKETKPISKDKKWTLVEKV